MNQMTLEKRCNCVVGKEVRYNQGRGDEVQSMERR